ncbi:MAG: hypothetical protein ACFFDN_30110 [Candidatus Hodarchaeota archaeon]
MILKSSEKSYHVVFNRKVSWSENIRAMAWASLYSKIIELDTWFHMQCIKESSTLRVSPKREKPSPRIVYREAKQDNQIANFLDYRKMFKKIMKNLS